MEIAEGRVGKRKIEFLEAECLWTVRVVAEEEREEQEEEVLDER